MKAIPDRYVAPKALRELRSFIQAADHASETSMVCPNDADEFEIDVDREIECLKQLSGIHEEDGCSAAQARAFVAWIAGICADSADRGGGRIEMGKATAIAVRHHARPWRNLACMFSRRCAALAACYAAEDTDAPSGEVIRWLFAEGTSATSLSLH